MQAVAPRERTLAMLCHLAAFIGVVVPTGNILGPLVVWLAGRGESAFVDDQGKESLNFQISIALYFLGLLVLVAILFADSILAIIGGEPPELTIPVRLPLWLLAGLAFIALAVFDFIAVIVAAVRANDGERFRYPATLRLVR